MWLVRHTSQSLHSWCCSSGYAPCCGTRVCALRVVPLFLWKWHRTPTASTAHCLSTDTKETTTPTMTSEVEMGDRTEEEEEEGEEEACPTMVRPTSASRSARRPIRIAMTRTQDIVTQPPPPLTQILLLLHRHPLPMLLIPCWTTCSTFSVHRPSCNGQTDVYELVVVMSDGSFGTFVVANISTSRII
jgi:hypothetical protein